MAEQQAATVAEHVAKHRVTRPTRGGLQAVAIAVDFDTPNPTLDMHFFAFIETVPFPGIGVRVQAMIDVNRHQRRRPCSAAGKARCGDQ